MAPNDGGAADRIDVVQSWVVTASWIGIESSLRRTTPSASGQTIAIACPLLAPDGQHQSAWHTQRPQRKITCVRMRAPGRPGGCPYEVAMIRLMTIRLAGQTIRWANPTERETAQRINVEQILAT